MPSFIFLTSDPPTSRLRWIKGQTLAPNLKDVDNLQVLGIANGQTYREALDNLLRENVWIKESDYEEVMVLELRSEKVEICNLKSEI